MGRCCPEQLDSAQEQERLAGTRSRIRTGNPVANTLSPLGYTDNPGVNYLFDSGVVDYCILFRGGLSCLYSPLSVHPCI